MEFTDTVLVIIALLVVIAGLDIKLSNESEMHKIYQEAFNRQVNENKHILNLAKETQKFNENMLKEKENLMHKIDELESEIVKINYQRQLDNGTLEFCDICPNCNCLDEIKEELEPTEVQNEEI